MLFPFEANIYSISIHPPFSRLKSLSNHLPQNLYKHRLQHAFRREWSKMGNVCRCRWRWYCGGRRCSWGHPPSSPLILSIFYIIIHCRKEYLEGRRIPKNYSRICPHHLALTLSPFFFPIILANRKKTFINLILLINNFNIIFRFFLIFLKWKKSSGKMR